MHFIDPHVHMTSRTTDDYVRLAQMGCVAVTEPAFWLGFDRTSAESFRDYYRHLTEFEPKRAAQYGIRHYCWICVNAKDAENIEIARETLKIVPEFLKRPTVLGVGEIGLNKNTRNECAIFAEQVELAARTNELILVHTPHLADKYKGTRMILDMIRENGRIRPERVLIDHCEEHTIKLALDAGHFAGITLYPTTKATPQRAADLIERFGIGRTWVNSSADWGPSDPFAVPAFMLEMRLRGHTEEQIQRVVYDTPVKFMSQSAHWGKPE